MLTVIESPLFEKLWPLYWSEEERGEFAAHIALNPTAGVVIRESGGLRKIRWAREGSGKSGGVIPIPDRKDREGEPQTVQIARQGEANNEIFYLELE